LGGGSPSGWSKPARKFSIQKGFEIFPPKAFVDLRLKNHLGGDFEQVVSCAGAKQSEKRSSRFITLPELPENTEDRDLGIESVELRQVTERGSPSYRCPFPKHVPFEDRLLVNLERRIGRNLAQ